MKPLLDRFIEYMEKKTPPGVCWLCQGSGKTLYQGHYTRCFEDICCLCNGTGKRQITQTPETVE